MNNELQAVFLDRDGTIGGSNVVEYPGEFKLFPYTAEVIEQFKANGIQVFLLRISLESAEQKQRKMILLENLKLSVLTKSIFVLITIRKAAHAENRPPECSKMRQRSIL